jgi:hypothetical protein
MENVTRRAFIGSSAAVAAGAAVGLTASQGIRRYGPVEVRTYFLSKDPVVIQGEVFSDERRDVFRFILLHEGKDAACAEIRLSDVRNAVAFPSKTTRCRVTMWNKNGTIHDAGVNLVAKDGNLTVLVDELVGPPSPIWMGLSDVQRVL